MKRYLACLSFVIFLFLGASLYAYGNDSSNLSGDSNNSSNVSTNTNSSTQNTGNAQLLDKINKETQKGLKVFKNVVKSQNSSKTDFFANVGKNPTAAEFEGKSGTDTILEQTFKFKDPNQ